MKMNSLQLFNSCGDGFLFAHKIKSHKAKEKDHLFLYFCKMLHLHARQSYFLYFKTILY